MAAVLVACFAATASAQSPPPAFEVASVRPSGPDSGPMSLQRQPGGRLIATNAPLAFLVSWAFNLDDGRLLGAPSGADSARFDIVAKAPTESPAPGQLQLMLRTLLVERFGPLTHPERRDRTAYVLVTDRDNLKIGLTTPPEAPDSNPFSMTEAGVLRGRRVTMDMLAKALSSQLKAPVENGTKIAGSFDFALVWQPAEAPNGDLSRPSLFTALREQLGLRLDVRRTQVEVMVIDRLSLTPVAD
jgi:uncharacterized protein (TIGR03435 family)